MFGPHPRLVEASGRSRAFLLGRRGTATLQSDSCVREWVVLRSREAPPRVGLPPREGVESRPADPHKECLLVLPQARLSLPFGGRAELENPLHGEEKGVPKNLVRRVQDDQAEWQQVGVATFSLPDLVRALPPGGLPGVAVDVQALFDELWFLSNGHGPQWLVVGFAIGLGSRDGPDTLVPPVSI